MTLFDKKILVTATALGALTIAIGAFGAHGLKQIADAEAVASFQTGVRYQMYHVLALLIVGFTGFIPKKTKKWVFWCFLGGIILFSGSIYVLALGDQVPFNTRFLGPVTPVGGLLFILGWLVLLFGVLRTKAGEL